MATDNPNPGTYPGAGAEETKPKQVSGGTASADAGGGLYQEAGSNIRMVGDKPVQFNAGIPMTTKAVGYKNAKPNSLYRKNVYNGTGMIVRDFNINKKLADTGAAWTSTSQNWGFQFHYNPSEFSEAYTPPTNLDYVGFMQDIAQSGLFLMPTMTGGSIQFELLLNRREDMVILPKENWQDYYAATERPSIEERKDILAKGTQYDIEFFFRVINLDPIEVWTGEKTSDWGLLMAMPVILSMGDSEGCRKFRGQVLSLNILHMQYAPGMIPVYSKLSFSFARWPDMFGEKYEVPPADPTETDAGSGDTGDSVDDGWDLPNETVFDGMNAAQTIQAKLIYQEVQKMTEGGRTGGKRKGLTADHKDRLTKMAWMTAWVESKMNNQAKNGQYLGLYQQSPSWGSASERQQAGYSTRAFIGGIDGPNKGSPKGALDFEDWPDYSLAELCQKVEGGAASNQAKYAAVESKAQRWLEQIRAPVRVPGVETPAGDPGNCPKTKFNTEKNIDSDTLKLMRCVYRNYPNITQIHTLRKGSTDPYGHGAGKAADFMLGNNYKSQSVKDYGWSMAKWIKANADKFNVYYVIFDDKIWSTQRDKEGWRPYGHPSGSKSDTDRHLDHVHVSVWGSRRGSGGK